MAHPRSSACVHGGIARLGVDGVGAEELAQDRLRGLLIGCSDRMVAKAH